MDFLVLFNGTGPPVTQRFPIAELWYFLPFGYLLTILIEAPILILGLSPKLSFKDKFFSGIWLTACTYPIVVLVLPVIFFGATRILYLSVAETFAPLAECVLFWLVFRGKAPLSNFDWLRCFAVIVIANLASFGVGEVLNMFEWLGIFIWA
jgi:hypothetical protein